MLDYFLIQETAWLKSTFLNTTTSVYNSITDDKILSQHCLTKAILIIIYITIPVVFLLGSTCREDVDLMKISKGRVVFTELKRELP